MSSTPSSVRPKINLLLVDDQHRNLIALEAVLSNPDYELIFARSGTEAIDLAQKHDIALVLLDVQMPGMDGYETATRLKALDRCRDIPIILITAFHTQDPAVKKGYEVGAIDYFTKPFDPEILRLKVGVYAAFRQKTYLLHERERRIQEAEALLQAGQKLSAIFETLPIGVVVADADSRVCWVNEEVARIWGFVESMQRHDYGEFLGWWDEDGKLIKAADGPMARALSSGEPTQNELTRIKCLDATFKTVRNSASPLRNLQGEVFGAVLVIQDVTQHKEIAADMTQRIRNLISLGGDCEQTRRS